jgi:ubiquinone/menaquinone biosynthesis C-methylase UbiE
MLERVKAKSVSENLKNIRYVHGASGEGKLDPDNFDRAVLVTVLGEIPSQKTALSEIFESLKPNGLLAVTEVIADPHFQPRDKIRQIAGSVGFAERSFFGNRFSFTILFEKPLS